MSVTVFKDIEEAILREVRRITFHDSRTVDRTVLEDTYDPFTGELVQTPIEPSLYDSSADASHIQYPHFFQDVLLFGGHLIFVLQNKPSSKPILYV